MIIVFLVAIWLGFIFLRVPIGISLINVSMIYFLITGSSPSFAIQKMVDALKSYTLLAVPLFILTGLLLNSGGITTRIFSFARSLVGHIPGGLGHVNVLASLFFSGMSGSAMADSGGLGQLEIKAMRDAGYDDAFSGSVTAASSMIGPLVPPSITMVLYGVYADTSTGALFLGGIVPGFLCAFALMVMVYVISVRRKYPYDAKRASSSEIWKGFLSSFWALLTPFIIIIGIFSGKFSPTQAAAITVLYALILDRLIYKELTWSKFFDALYETARTTSSIGILVAGVGLFGFILAKEQAPQQITEFFLSFTSSPLSFLIIVNVVLFILGAFVESLAILLLLTPILAPIAVSYGIDPVHFGIIMVLNLMISILTPPMGVSLFIVAKVGNIPYPKLARAIVIWLIPPITVLLLVIFFPALVTTLPNLLMPSA